MKKISLCQLRNNRYVLLICFLFSNICVFSQGKINVIEAYYIDEGYSYASNHIEIALCECCCPYLFITLQMNKYDIDSVMLRSYADFEKNKCTIYSDGLDTVFYSQIIGTQKQSLYAICGIDTSDSTVAVVKLFGEAYDVRLLFSDISLYQNDLKHKFKKLKRELMGSIRLYYRDDTGQFYETTISRVTTVADENEKLKILQKYW